MSHAYPQPGTILAERYRVEEVIGRGGMGVVLAAENTITQRRVAIKWLRSDLIDNPQAAERLVREASVASRIRHPNVVDVFDVMRDGTSIFLVMELLKGESLEAVLHRGGIPLHELIGMIVPAMRGVAEAHRQEIVHRDIHPGNIFLSRESHAPRPVPKVLDFGISKFGKISAEQRALTRSNMCMGTPLYMSYEQLYSARDVDIRTDVYSFGVILYEGLTGKPPFDGESLMEVASKITIGTPVHPKTLRPEIPSALAELVLWAIARNREERIQTIEAFIRELEPFATEQAFRGQMTDCVQQMPGIARNKRAVDAAPILDHVDALQAAERNTSRPPVEQASAATDQAARVTPLLTTLASRPALAKRIDTLGQPGSQLAQSLRPGSRLAAHTSFGIAAAIAIFIGGAIAFWKFSAAVPRGAGVERTALSGGAVPAITPKPMLSPTVEPLAPVPLQPAAASLPTQPAPASPPSVVSRSGKLPSAHPTHVLGPRPADKKPTPTAVTNRAGPLNEEDLY